MLTWKHNIKMDLGKSFWKCVNWDEAVEDRVKLWYFVLMVMNFRISYQASVLFSGSFCDCTNICAAW
jgi:hypothetical protein